MPPTRLKLYAFGSSLLSAYWNGAATYYQGIYKHLQALGYRITFAEPDILDRQAHRDWPNDPPYAQCRVYRGRQELEGCLREAMDADLIIKHSGVGAEDEFLQAAVPAAAAAAPAGLRPRTAFWDVDAPATLAEIAATPSHPLRQLLPLYDYVFTYGGGPAVVRQYRQYGARVCFPIYNGLDPTTHFPVAPRPCWQSDLTFLGHCLPDRQARVEQFFSAAARRQPGAAFRLAGEGWAAQDWPGNVQLCGFVPPQAHNALNCSARLVLNLNRDAMARVGFSPPTRIFEAAGAAACVISDDWPGISLFFEPGREIMVAAGGADVAERVRQVRPEEARKMGLRMRDRALAEHTYARRAQRVDGILHGAAQPRGE